MEEKIHIVIEHYRKGKELVFDFRSRKDFENFLSHYGLQNNESTSMIKIINYDLEERLCRNRFQRTYILDVEHLKTPQIEPYNDSYLIGYIIKWDGKTQLIKGSRE